MENHCPKPIRCKGTYLKSCVFRIDSDIQSSQYSIVLSSSMHSVSSVANNRGFLPATSSGRVQGRRRAAGHRGDRRRPAQGARAPDKDHLHLALPQRRHVLAHEGICFLSFVRFTASQFSCARQPTVQVCVHSVMRCNFAGFPRHFPQNIWPRSFRVSALKIYPALLKYLHMWRGILSARHFRTFLLEKGFFF